jgi:soluble lytic murein transglycosylase-like protein
MQVNNGTYSTELAGTNGLPPGNTPRDPALNIMAGASELARMKKKFGSWDLALRGYNSGENGVDLNDPNARPAGTGDPNYIPLIHQHAAALINGTPLANRG